MAEAPVADSDGGGWTGAAAAPGRAAGPAFVVRSAARRVRQGRILASQVDDELARLDTAIAHVNEELSRTERHLKHTPPNSHSQIAAALITSHRAVLTDPLLIDGARDHIREQKHNAEWALECVVDELRNALFQLENPELRDWWRDVEALIDTLLTALGNKRAAERFAPDAGVVAVAERIGISDTVDLIAAGGAGLVLEQGSLTSHVAVLCRAAGLPAVVGVQDACSRVENGRMLVIDGDKGWVAHDDAAVAAKRPGAMPDVLDTPAMTACGTSVTVRANLSYHLDPADARGYGVRGVGLMRTFYQYVGRTNLPSEDELAAIYTAVTEGFAPEPVTIRLLDLGGTFGAEELPAELRRLRDCRGIRLVNERPEVLRTQMRALSRASAAGNLLVLVPFVTDPNELQRAREMFTTALDEVAQNGHKTAVVRLGAMVEVPAAVLQIDAIAAQADFLAIGTNDLAQYMLASSRDRPFYDNPVPHPSVLEAIRQVCRAGARHQLPVSLCGEAASEVDAIPALLQCGLRELSVSPRFAPAVVEAINSCTIATNP